MNEPFIPMELLKTPLLVDDKLIFEKSHLESHMIRKQFEFCGYDEPNIGSEYIRFKMPENGPDRKTLLADMVKEAYQIIEGKSELFISVIGGLKRMKIPKQLEISFQKGLFDIMKRYKIVFITGGFGIGIDQLVSKTVKEFRNVHTKKGKQVTLIGIATWGVILNKNHLENKEFSGRDSSGNKLFYKNPETVKYGPGQVALDYNCDRFLFCDDGSNGVYDREQEFRLEFEKYIQSKQRNIIVQILFEGGYRAFERISGTLSNNISVIAFNHSKRAANLISEVVQLDRKNFDKFLVEKVTKYKKDLWIPEKDIGKTINRLKEMFDQFREQIFIFDIHQDKRFGKKILEAVIYGKKELTMARRLELTVQFNCADVAQLCMDSVSKDIKDNNDNKVISDCVIEVLKDDKHEFVELFFIQGVEFKNIITVTMIRDLYQKLSKDTKKPYYQLFKDKNGNTHSKPEDILPITGVIMSNLSGYILPSNYGKQNKGSDKKHDIVTDLFFWALLGCRFQMANIFWRYGKFHVSSALVAAIILKNMALRTNKQGNDELNEVLIRESQNFEDLACKVLTVAHDENKKKSIDILIRKLSYWNDKTCLEIAISGELMNFLSHKACKSYTTQVWNGGLSPFLTQRLIVMSSFFFVFTFQFIRPYIRQERSKKTEKTEKPIETSKQSKTNHNNSLDFEKNDKSSENKIPFMKSLKIFYFAPVVKFYINFITYILFLITFAYLNLVELKPRDHVLKITDILAEIFVYVFFLTFVVEEARQISIRKTPGLYNKFKAYFSGSCNQQDAGIILIFTISIVTRFCLLGDSFMFCRCLFSLCFCLFCLRTLQFYFAFEFFGPKVLMIFKMMHDISFFFGIFILFIISYGTLSQSIRHPNSRLNITLLHDIIQKPYFQTYGELMLDSILEATSCKTTSCYVKYTTVLISFAVYLLLTNILLVNLLIAMFGHTFNKIQEQSGKHWAFIRLQLVEEFYNKPFPYIYRFYSLFFKWNCNSIDNIDYHPLIKTMSEEEDPKISGFEKYCMDITTYESCSEILPYDKNQSICQESKTSCECSNEFDCVDENQEIESICDKILKRWENRIGDIVTNKLREFQERLDSNDPIHE